MPLEISEIKQIAGRAGRYKTAHQAVAEAKAKASAPEPAIGLDDTPVVEPENTTIGCATTLDQIDFRGLREGMEREAEPIKTAGLFPPSLIVERFANYFPPGTPFSYIMLRLHEICNVHPRFQLCALKDQLAIADAIHLIRNLSVQDRIMLCAAPSNMRDQAEKAFLQELATCIAEHGNGDLLDLPNLPLEILDTEPSGERDYLKNLERLHKMLVLYLWLSYRFPNVFISRKLTTHVTKLVEERIEQTLTRFSFTQQYQDVNVMRRKAIKKLTENKERGSETNTNGSHAGVVATDMSHTLGDALGDTHSIDDEVALSPNDEYECPTLEVDGSGPDDEETERLKPGERVEDFDEVGVYKANGTENTQTASDPAEDVSTEQAHSHIGLTADQLDTTQPRI